MPERVIYRLSDHFIKTSGVPEMELTVTLLNINPGFNTEIVSRCPTLAGYVELIARIRKNQQYMDRTQAVARAVDSCIADGILVDFLTRNTGGIMDYLNDPIDYEKVQALLREEAIEEGIAQGMAQGKVLQLIELIQKKAAKGASSSDIASALEEEPSFVEKIMDLSSRLGNPSSEDIYQQLYAK